MDFWSGCFFRFTKLTIGEKIEPRRKSDRVFHSILGCLIGILTMVNHGLHTTEDFIPYPLETSSGLFSLLNSMQEKDMEQKLLQLARAL